MNYEIPRSAHSRRFFSRQVHYSEIDWGSLPEIVRAYQQRVQDWYLSPAQDLAKSPHHAFSVMAINCLLVDALSQYFVGSTKSSGTNFKCFIRHHLPLDYSAPLPTQIQHDDGTARKTLNDIADVLYHGFRCSILHQAHLMPYCGVVPNGRRVNYASGLIVYKATGEPCPTVLLNPLALLEDLTDVFTVYIENLLNPDQQYNDRRDKFKATFSGCFGVDISGASL